MSDVTEALEVVERINNDSALQFGETIVSLYATESVLGIEIPGKDVYSSELYHASDYAAVRLRVRLYALSLLLAVTDDTAELASLHKQKEEVQQLLDAADQKFRDS